MVFSVGGVSAGGAVSTTGGAGSIGASAEGAGSGVFSSWGGISSARQAGHRVEVLPSSRAAPHLTQFFYFFFKNN